MKYILDVRTKEEFEQFSIPGSINHDIMNLMNGDMPNLDKDAEIVLCCQSGNRSMMAEKILRENGFTNIVNGGSVFNLV